MNRITGRDRKGKTMNVKPRRMTPRIIQVIVPAFILSAKDGTADRLPHLLLFHRAFEIYKH